MKRLCLSLILSVSALCGCAHSYVMKLNNGLMLTSASKPKLKGAYYYYTDVAGRQASVAAARVREIEPASMAKEENNQFKVPAAK